ncbi:MAG TPA: DUF6789 family protein [Chloroflexota bacterium]|nr:DUF6789 family protein [Chloroflexota bacterium]
MLSLDLDPTFSPSRAVMAGATAAVAYVGIMYADMAITGSPTNELLMLGRPLTADRTKALLVGLAAHMGVGTAMGVIYGAVGRRRLPGPDWARGVLMMLMENTILWPAALVIDRVHPSMRSGELPRLNTPVSVAQQIARHSGFGAVMGALYGDGSGTLERIRRPPDGGH